MYMKHTLPSFKEIVNLYIYMYMNRSKKYFIQDHFWELLALIFDRMT